MVQNIGKSQTIRIIVVRKFHRLLNIANIIITISHVLYVLHLNNTVCSKTKVTKINTLLFCKVFIATIIIIIMSVLPKGRSFTTSTETKVAVLLKAGLLL